MAENFSLLESRNVANNALLTIKTHKVVPRQNNQITNQFNTPTLSFGGGMSDPFLSNGETINISDIIYHSKV